MSFSEEGILDDERVKEESEGPPRTLSHSSHQTLNQCEARYYYYKVMRLPPDPDIDPDTYSFRFGKALHKLMEDTWHKRKNYRNRLLLDAMEEQELEEEDFYKLYACAMAYYAAAEESGLDIRICELPIRSTTTLGYIDAIGVDSKGRFWIVDLKTTGWWKDILPTRLARDPQLSLYASHLHLIVDELRERGIGVNESDFAGVSYRAVCKTKTVPKVGRESPEAYAKRADPQVHFINIPKTAMDVKGVVEEHGLAWRRAMELNTAHNPRRNYSACVEWNRVCEYYSHCYGKTHTEMKKLIHHATSGKPVDVGEIEIEQQQTSQGDNGMLNVIVKETNWFPADKSARIVVAVSFGANSEIAPTLIRPYFFQAGEDGLTCEFMDKAVEAAMKQATVAFWMHMADLRGDAIYQSWVALLKPANAIPANAETLAKLEKGSTPKPTAPAPEAAKPAPKAPAKPVKEEEEAEEVEEEEEEAPKPAAKKGKAPAKVVEEEEEEEEKPKKGKAPAKKKVDEVVWATGKPELSPILMKLIDENFPKNWKEKPKYKKAAGVISKTLASEEVIVLRDGETTEEFIARANELIEEV